MSIIDNRIPLANKHIVRISNDSYTIRKLFARGETSLIYEAVRVYCDNKSSSKERLPVDKKVLLKELAPLDIDYYRDKKGQIIVSND